MANKPPNQVVFEKGKISEESEAILKELYYIVKELSSLEKLVHNNKEIRNIERSLDNVIKALPIMEKNITHNDGLTSRLVEAFFAMAEKLDTANVGNADFLSTAEDLIKQNKQ